MKNLLLLILFLPLLAFGQEKKHKIFKYDKFKVTKKLKLLGNAKFIDGGLRLTSPGPWQRGACWFREQVAVTKGFTLEFQMKFSENDLEMGGADGIAFVIQNDPSRLGLGRMGEGMGYSGLANCLVIEFDSYDNGEGSDNHVSIQTNGKGKVSRFAEHTIAINHHVPKFRNGTSTVKVIYKKEHLKIYIEGKLVINKAFDLSKNLDLTAGKAYVGFTSATAKAYAQHEILYWNWDSIDIPIAAIPVFKKGERVKQKGILRKKEVLV